MSISAMKQALEALERGRSQIIGALVQQDQDDAIKALRQAIAEAEQEDWYGQWQWQCGYERGWDAAMDKAAVFRPSMKVYEVEETK